MGFNVDFLSTYEELTSPSQTLQNICSNYIVNNLNQTLLIESNQSEVNHKVRRSNVKLPTEVSQKIFDFALRNENIKQFDCEMFEQEFIQPVYGGQGGRQVILCEFFFAMLLKSVDSQIQF